MSTEIEVKGNFYLTRYWGGVDRGVCFQITQSNGPHIWLRHADAKEMAEAILVNLMPEKSVTE